MSTERRLLGVMLLAVCAACFEAKELPPAPGGESNFLRTCDGACEGGLSCVCGVCTRTCTSDQTCSSLASNAMCLGKDPVGDTRSCEPAERKKAQAVCDTRCSKDSECGAGLQCAAGLCREAATTTDAGGSSPEPVLAADAPVVMLLVDTSGSMGDLPGCTCASDTDCTNCQPDCAAGQQNRWFTLLAALTGSYSDFGCQQVSRTAANGATYDEGYSMPNYVLAPSSSQRSDGLIDAYGSRIQFGLATFDSEYTYKGGSDLMTPAAFDYPASTGQVGMFSYAGAAGSEPRTRPDGSIVGRVFYPGTPETYYVDSGLRSSSASEGALRLPGIELPLSERSLQLRTQLRAARPYAGTPTAAALDDLYFFFTQDEASRELAPNRKRHVVLLTDGAPDPDFRDLGCACRTTEECLGGEPSQMRCPYPIASEAARHLRCGFDKARCSGPIEAVHVVGFSVRDTAARAQLDDIAAEGGGERARFADDQPQLRAALRAVLEKVLAN